MVTFAVLAWKANRRVNKDRATLELNLSIISVHVFFSLEKGLCVCDRIKRVANWLNSPNMKGAPLKDMMCCLKTCLWQLQNTSPPFPKDFFFFLERVETWQFCDCLHGNSERVSLGLYHQKSFLGGTTPPDYKKRAERGAVWKKGLNDKKWENKRKEHKRSHAFCLEVWKKSNFKNRRQQRTAIIKHICRAADSKRLLTQTVSLLLHQTKLVFKGNFSLSRLTGFANYFHRHHRRLLYFICISPTASLCIFSHLNVTPCYISTPTQTDETGKEISTQHFHKVSNRYPCIAFFLGGIVRKFLFFSADRKCQRHFTSVFERRSLLAWCKLQSPQQYPMQSKYITLYSLCGSTLPFIIIIKTPNGRNKGLLSLAFAFC